VDEEGRIRIRALSGEEQITLMDPTGTDRVAILSATNKRIVSFGKSADLRIWNVDTRTVLHTLPGHSGGVRDAVITPDERWVFSVGADRKLRIWDVATGKEDSVIDLPETASCIRILPKADVVATVSASGANGAIQLWHISAKQRASE